MAGDVTNVMTVSKSHEKKEVKLRKRVSNNIATQFWNLRFERYRVLQPNPCDLPPPTPSSTYPSSPSVPTTPSTTQPIPSSKYPPSPSVPPTNAPTRWDQVS